MYRPLILGAAFTALTVFGVSRVHSLQSEVQQLSLSAVPSARVEPIEGLGDQVAALDNALEQGLEEAFQGLEDLRRDMIARADQLLRDQQAVLEGPAAELNALHTELEALRGEYDSLARLAQHQARALASVDDVREEVQEEVAHALQSLREEEEQRWSGLSEAVTAAAHRVERVDDQVATLGTKLRSTDAGVRWTNMVAPTVRLEGLSTVGSGVVLRSRPHPDGRGHQTLLLTAWHVVRDIQADAIGPDKLVPVEIHKTDGSRHELARLIAKNVELDAALLELRTREPVAHGARLASRATLASTRIFDDIYAVGCPLGNEPIPTRGEVADLDHELDGTEYWMLSAPTYIGNSGGGIFDGERHVLLALFSKIYTHGTIRPTVIPHMGLASPLDAIYDWLEAGRIARVVRDEDGTSVHLELLNE